MPAQPDLPRHHSRIVRRMARWCRTTPCDSPPLRIAQRDELDHPDDGYPSSARNRNEGRHRESAQSWAGPNGTLPGNRRRSRAADRRSRRGRNRGSGRCCGAYPWTRGPGGDGSSAADGAQEAAAGGGYSHTVGIAAPAVMHLLRGRGSPPRLCGYFLRPRSLPRRGRGSPRRVGELPRRVRGPPRRVRGQGFSQCP